MSDNNTPHSPAPTVVASRRKPAMLAVAGTALLVGLVWGGWHWLTQRHHEATDNAYVQAPVVQITPQVGGTVLAVLADDTDIVKAGQPLVRLDPADAKLALERAEAQLAQTVREVRTLYTNNGALAANIRLREAEVVRMQADVARAQDDVARRQPLMASGAVGGEEMKHAESTLTAAKSALASAQSALAAAREQAASNEALTSGTSVDKHPNVERAAAAVREAWLAVRRTDLPAPVTGQVAKRTVQVGQRVAPGTPLMSVIPLDQVWVEANFKEVQLRNIRIGQPVTADGRRLRQARSNTRARVAGLGRRYRRRFRTAAGAERHRQLDQGGCSACRCASRWTRRNWPRTPLRVGLSMEATVDVGATRKARLRVSRCADRAASAVQHDGVYSAMDKDANADKCVQDHFQQCRRSAPQGTRTVSMPQPPRPSKWPRPAAKPNPVPALVSTSLYAAPAAVRVRPACPRDTIALSAGDLHECVWIRRSPTCPCRRSPATWASARTQGTWVITSASVWPTPSRCR